jgi:membrane-associated protease RseP (regulator of RpoE activity)
MVAAILFTGAIAQAQPDKPPERSDAERGPGGYWIGLRIGEVPEALRKQLKLPGDGAVFVEQVAPGSPAAKAGIEPDDVLLSAEGELLADARDLAIKIARSEGKPMKVELYHGGEKKTVEVTPEKHPPRPHAMPDDRMPLTDRLFRVLRPGLPIDLEFPKDLSVTIHKQGDQPAKVTVERGDKKWEVTDRTLGELPDEVRGYVELYLGKLPTPPLPPEVGEQLSRALPVPPGVPEDVERHLRREAGRLERRLGEEALPRVRDLQERLRDVERRLEERLRDVEKRLERSEHHEEGAPKGI